MPHVKLTPEVTDILTRATVEGTVLILPPGQLERKLYEQVAKAIAAAGGKWNRSKQGFLFAADPKEALGLALETGVVEDRKKTRQAFYTPPLIAMQVVKLADVAGHAVLEPSAGEGALVEKCVAYGASEVCCIELDTSCREPLEQIAGASPVRVAIGFGDFMKLPPHRLFSRIVMNPPFTKGQYHKHVARALEWLEPGGSLFAIVPDNGCRKLEAMGAVKVVRIPEGAFKDSGTMVATRLIRIDAKINRPGRLAR